MTSRELPVRPQRGALEAEARQLAREQGLAESVAREALAREYGITSWQRLETACRVIEAIWSDDRVGLRSLLERDPRLLDEDARGVRGNWGPPLSYAANLGRDELVRMLLAMGASDLRHAFDRACLQGRVGTARILYDAGARPLPGCLMGPAETQDADGFAFLLSLGVQIGDAEGDPRAVIALLLQTYCRDPEGKHRCLELLAEHGVTLPDTPTMAVHRGRFDLLERHLARDPDLFARTFTHEQIYPPSLGCHADPSLALHGAPLDGGTLLHLCVDDDAIEMARWMLARGASADGRAAVDRDGFGGHTALFGCVVSQPFRVGRRRDDAFARLLLDHGCDPRVRVNLRKRLRFVADESEHEYLGVTACEFGTRFHDQGWVNPAVTALLHGR
ncbi:MAG: ankyrin repeat domain-containing protein [Planctomycetota bacterium]